MWVSGFLIVLMIVWFSFVLLFLVLIWICLLHVWVRSCIIWGNFVYIVWIGCMWVLRMVFCSLLVMRFRCCDAAIMVGFDVWLMCCRMLLWDSISLFISVMS